MRKFKTGAYVWYHGMVCCIHDCRMRAGDGSTEPYEVKLHRYDAYGSAQLAWCPTAEVQLLLTRDDLDRLALQVHEATTCQS